MADLTLMARTSDSAVLTFPQHQKAEQVDGEELDLFSTTKMGASPSTYYRDSLKEKQTQTTMAAVTSKETQTETLSEPSFLKKMGEWVMSFFWQPTKAQTNDIAMSDNISIDTSEVDISTEFAKPRIELPEVLDEATSIRLTQQMNAFLDGIRRDKKEASHTEAQELDEMAVYRLCGASWVKYKSTKEGVAMFSKTELSNNLDAKEQLHLKSNEKEKERLEADHTANVLGWVGTALTVGIIVGTGGILIAGIGAAGVAGISMAGVYAALTTAASPTISLLMGAATLAKGINRGAQTYYEHIGENATSEMIGIRSEQDMLKLNIDLEIGKFKNLLQHFTNYWKQRKELERSRFDAGRLR